MKQNENLIGKRTLNSLLNFFPSFFLLHRFERPRRRRKKNCFVLWLYMNINEQFVFFFGLHLFSLRFPSVTLMSCCLVGRAAAVRTLEGENDGKTKQSSWLFSLVELFCVSVFWLLFLSWFKKKIVFAVYKNLIFIMKAINNKNTWGGWGAIKISAWLVEWALQSLKCGNFFCFAVQTNRIWGFSYFQGSDGIWFSRKIPEIKFSVKINIFLKRLNFYFYVHWLFSVKKLLFRTECEKSTFSHAGQKMTHLVILKVYKSPVKFLHWDQQQCFQLECKVLGSAYHSLSCTWSRAILGCKLKFFH